MRCRVFRRAAVLPHCSCVAYIRRNNDDCLPHFMILYFMMPRSLNTARPHSMDSRHGLIQKPASLPSLLSTTRTSGRSFIPVKTPRNLNAW